jgi:hypothetical protein
MSYFPKILGAIVLVVLSISSAVASDPRCNAPPYGGTTSKYKAFTETFGKIFENPDNTLIALCLAKFDGKNRAALYNLGITDADIDMKDTADLAIAVMDAIRSH